MPMERRGVGLRKQAEETCPDTEQTMSMTTRFACFTRKAQQATTQFTALMGRLSDPVELADSFQRVKDKAPGIDGVFPRLSPTGAGAASTACNPASRRSCSVEGAGGGNGAGMGSRGVAHAPTIKAMAAALRKGLQLVMDSSSRQLWDPARVRRRGALAWRLREVQTGVLQGMSGMASPSRRNRKLRCLVRSDWRDRAHAGGGIRPFRTPPRRD